MSVQAEPADGATTAPQPEFEVTSAAPLAYAAAPTMVFSVRVSEGAGHEIQSLVLSVQVMIDPAKRGYDAETRERLEELFGPPARWAPSTQGLPWSQVAVVVPSFREQTTFGLQLPCTFDLEVAATKFFYALADGEAPLTFHFNGQVFYRGPQGALQVTPVPWSRTAHFSMPVAAWRAMIEEHYPGWGWIRLQRGTLDGLNAYRSERGLPTFEACIEELLDGR